MSDRESDVRDTASKSLSLLICFCDDKDKLTSLVDSCLDVIVDDTIPIDNGLQVNKILTQFGSALRVEIFEKPAQNHNVC